MHSHFYHIVELNSDGIVTFMVRLVSGPLQSEGYLKAQDVACLPTGR
jgi:hypothetical protein